jgi:signal transduction histidine kinase/ligand-binding sensor domain-containing protein
MPPSWAVIAMAFLARHKPGVLFSLLVGLSILMAVSVPALAERFPIKTYGTPEGLGSSFIGHIFQDSHGYLWVCTRDGLSRFDGYSLKTYKTSDGLPSPTVSSILEDDDGTFWVTINGGGVCKFDPAGKSSPRSGNQNSSLFTTYLLGNTELSNRANIVYKDRQGSILVGTDEGLFRLDREAERERFKPVPLGTDPYGGNLQPGINAILQDRNGALWISAGVNGVYRISKDGRTAHYSPQRYRAFTGVTALLEDREGRLWVGTRTGLCRIEPRPETQEIKVHLHTRKDGLADNIILSLLETRDGHLWIGTANGLTEYDGRNFRSYDRRNGLSAISIHRLIEDRDGNLWIGTQSDGLMKFARNGFVTYGATDDKRLTDIKNIFEDEAGNLFVVSDDWSLSKMTPKGVYSTRLRLPADATTAWLSVTIMRDRAGEFWALTDGLGIFRFPKVSDIKQLSQTKPKAIYTVKTGLPGNRAGRAYEDSRGNIWFRIASLGRGDLVRWERATGTFHRCTEADGLPATLELSAIYEMKGGDIWFGFAGGKIYRYRDGRFTQFAEPSAPQRDTITALLFDSQNRLWIADNRVGVTRIDEPLSDQPAAIRYSTAEGLSSENARCISEDRWGRIYVGTVRGVDRINTATGEIKHFSSADGLSSDFTKFIYADRQHNLWIGTLNGISKFTPEPPAETAPPEVVISGLRVSGEAQPINELGATEIDNLELETGRNHVQIDFTAPAFGLGETLRFQYKLEGASQEWGPLTMLRTVNYASLSPGSYQFVVRAVNGEGVASARPAMASFTILPPVWRRWWFLALAAAILAIPVSLIIRYRHERKRAEQSLQREKEERLRELEEVRSRIAKDLHDDVGSSLTQVSLLTEVARQAMNGASEFAGEQLSIVAKLSRELVDSMSDIVWAVNPQKDRLDDLTHRMRRFASNLFTAQQIDFQFHTPDEDQEVKIGANMRRELFLIFKEGVNNIARHSKCARADLEFRFEGQRLFLKMRDDGRGFDHSQEGTGNGLVNMRERAHASGGDISIVSTPGNGTMVSVTIPLKHPPGRLNS